MRKETILITEADGPIGLATVRCILSIPHHNTRVVCGIMDPESREARELNQLGIPCVDIQPKDKERLAQTFEGVNSLFIVPSTEDEKIGHERAYIEAAKQSNVRFVLLLSVILAEVRKDILGRQFYQLEQYIQQSSLNYCILRAGVYQQLLLLFKNSITMDNCLPMPTGEGRYAPVNKTDLAKAAAHILVRPGSHFGKTYNITGPDCLTTSEIVQRMSTRLHKKIQFRDEHPETAREHMGSMLLHQSEAEAIKEELLLVRDGKLNFVSPNFKEITGEEATSLDRFFQEHSSDLTRLDQAVTVEE
ncbi:uncharacterized protein VTP21DRAFT_9494 [Calcarisporiella thermophila]|uniref:uncharacterized protein n=1 Tax=Calcarisporiella thermophila TaxID=911321 RepID=UPI003743F34D